MDSRPALPLFSKRKWSAGKLQALVSLIIRLQLHTPNHRKRELRKTREKAEKTQETEDGKKHEKKARGWLERGRTERKRTRGKFWSINQQHLVLLPPLSSSWTEKTGQRARKGKSKTEKREKKKEGENRDRTQINRGKTQKKTGELEKTETERSIGQPTHKHQSCLGLHHLLNRRTQRKTESMDEERANTVERERDQRRWRNP